jgi:hypothetical protein
VGIDAAQVDAVLLLLLAFTLGLASTTGYEVFLLFDESFALWELLAPSFVWLADFSLGVELEFLLSLLC